jgi:hypothetical protein
VKSFQLAARLIASKAPAISPPAASHRNAKARRSPRRSCAGDSQSGANSQSAPTSAKMVPLRVRQTSNDCVSPPLTAMSVRLTSIGSHWP